MGRELCGGPIASASTCHEAHQRLRWRQQFVEWERLQDRWSVCVCRPKRCLFCPWQRGDVDDYACRSASREELVDRRWPSCSDRNTQCGDAPSELAVGERRARDVVRAFRPPREGTRVFSDEAASSFSSDPAAFWASGRRVGAARSVGAHREDCLFHLPQCAASQSGQSPTFRSG